MWSRHRGFGRWVWPSRGVVALLVVALAAVVVPFAPLTAQDEAVSGYLPGSLDSSFGSGGVTVSSFSSKANKISIRHRQGFAVRQTLSGFDDSDELYAAALQGDGKVVVVGQAVTDDHHDIILGRYDVDGSLDTSCATDGWLNYNRSRGVIATQEHAYAVAVQGDGKIVVAGWGSDSNDGEVIVVLRFDADCSLDTTFDSDGVATAHFGTEEAYGHSLVIQGDGKIVVGGYLGQGSFQGPPDNRVLVPNQDFVLVRFNADGSLDTSFSSDGKVTTDFGALSDEAYSVALQGDGKFVVAGFSYNGTNREFALVRYNTDGSLDTTFGSGGKVTTPVDAGDAEAYSVALQADGKIVAGGIAENASGKKVFAVVRYNTDGSLDTTFGSGGKVTTSLTDSDDEAYSLKIQSDSRIVVAGYSNENKFALVRYNTDGSLDRFFGSAGKITTKLYPDITDPDFSGAGLMEEFDGTLVTTAFVPATAGNPRPEFRRVGMVLQPDGNIVVAGAAQTNAWSLTLPNLGDDAFPIPDSFATTVTRFTDSVVARYSGNDLVLIGSIAPTNTFGYSTSGVRGSIVSLPIATNRPVESDLDITVEVLGSSTAVEWQNEDNPGDFRITEKTVTIPAGSRFARVAVRITDNADTDRKTIDLRITDSTDHLLRHPTYRNASISITPSINVQPTPTNPTFTPTSTVPPTTTVPPDTDDTDTDEMDDTDDTGTDDTDTDGGVDFTGTDENDAGTDDTDADSGDGVVQPAGFTDVDAASTHAANIDAIYAAGITEGCSSDPLQYCPNDSLTRAEMATFLVRALDLEPAQPAGFSDVDAASTHAANIDALHAAGITVGCDSNPLRYCPNDLVTRAEMATFLVRALDLEPAQPAGFSDVDAASTHAANIDAIYAAGITVGCNSDPLRYCPNDSITRAEMASFLVRALDLPTPSQPRN